MAFSDWNIIASDYFLSGDFIFGSRPIPSDQYIRATSGNDFRIESSSLNIENFEISFFHNTTGSSNTFVSCRTRENVNADYYELECQDGPFGKNRYKLKRRKDGNLQVVAEEIAGNDSRNWFRIRWFCFSCNCFVIHRIYLKEINAPESSEQMIIEFRDDNNDAVINSGPIFFRGFNEGSLDKLEVKEVQLTKPQTPKKWDIISNKFFVEPTSQGNTLTNLEGNIGEIFYRRGNVPNFKMTFDGRVDNDDLAQTEILFRKNSTSYYRFIIDNVGLGRIRYFLRKNSGSGEVNLISPIDSNDNTSDNWYFYEMSCLESSGVLQIIINSNVPGLGGEIFNFSDAVPISSGGIELQIQNEAEIANLTISEFSTPGIQAKKLQLPNSQNLLWSKNKISPNNQFDFVLNEKFDLFEWNSQQEVVEPAILEESFEVSEGWT